MGKNEKTISKYNYIMSNLTFGIIKPDAVRAGNAGKIVDRVLSNGFKVRGMKPVSYTHLD